MKRNFYVLMVALVAFSLNLMAQQPQQGQREQRTQWNPEQRAEQVAKDLELNADQQKQLKEMFVKQQDEMAKMREQPQGDQDARRQQFTEMRKKWDADMEKIVGPEKMAKWKALQEERARNRRNGQGNQN
jgi:Spy/CpxP family protein refolding chaperone